MEAKPLTKRLSSSERDRATQKEAEGLTEKDGPLTKRLGLSQKLRPLTKRQEMQGISTTEVKSNRLGLSRVARWCYI